MTPLSTARLARRSQPVLGALTGFVGVIILAASTVGAQAPPQGQRPDLRREEQAIRELIAKQGTPDAPSLTDDAIFVSGAYARPVIGNREKVKPLPAAKVDQRRNGKTDHRIRRIEVARAGDMAYEYSDFTMSYDLADTKERRVFDGSLLRVWTTVDGEWRIAATFARPNTSAP